MTSPVSIPPREAALALARQLKAAGHQAYFAGGSVRDRLLDLEPKDYDIATSATPMEVLALFPKSNEVGAHFGVIIAKHAGHHIEIATFRTDGSYRDGRRPDSVEFSTAKEDAQRRDFTINGLFEDPETGELIDYVGGQSDIAAGIIRAIGQPQKRFQEDALRLLRAVRFASHLGFTIEPNTQRALQDHAHLLEKISPERIRDEFSKILTSPRRRQGVECLVDTGLIQHFIPEVLPMIGCEQPPQWHPEGDVYTHTMIMLEMLAPDAPLALCLAVLFHDIAKPPCQTTDAESGRIRFNGHDAMGAIMAETIMRRLRYSNHLIDAVVPMVARHMQFMNVQKMRVAKLKRFMAEPTFPQEMELHRVDCGSSNGFTDNYEFLQAKEAEFAAEPLIPQPLVTGKDLIQLGLKPSPRFKELLEILQTEQLEGRILAREPALEYLKHLAAKSSPHLPMSSCIPVEHSDPINAKILAISEDQIAGFQRQPFHLIAEKSGVPLDTVLERIRAMQEAGIVRRVRQTLLSTKLAHGALVAWKVPEEKLNDAFDFMAKEDPFSGHVVIRSTDTDVSGSGYRLWTTLKVPVGESLDKHAKVLMRLTGATEYLLMPANGVFALGVGHTRRKTLEPGDKSDEPAVMMTTATVDLTPEEWNVLLALKEELTLDEICTHPWDGRARLAGVSLERFCEVAETLNAKKVIGRFSTFLEHVKPSATGERVTRFNGLFHWAVPKGREIEGGAQVGRHYCMTHCYWREGGPQFGNVNIMGVVHGTDKDRVLEHKAAIDRHLAAVGIPVSYTNVFWGGRSEIKPSEISPKIYHEWHAKQAI